MFIIKDKILLYFLIVFISFSSISFCDNNETYATTGIVEVTIAYKLLESVFWSLGTYVLVDSACRELTDDGIIDFPTKKEDFVLSDSPIKIIDLTRERFIRGGGSDPDPDPDKIVFGSPLTPEQIRNGFNAKNDDDVLAIANEIYSEMAENEKAKFLNREPFSVKVPREIRKNVEKVVVPLIDKMINPVELVDYTGLPLYSDEPISRSLGSLGFFSKSSNFDKTNEFVNLCIANNATSITYIGYDASVYASDSRGLRYRTMVDKNPLYTFGFNTTEGGLLIGFFNNDSITGSSYIATGNLSPENLPEFDCFVKKVNFSGEALIYGYSQHSSIAGMNMVSDSKVHVPMYTANRLSTLFEEGDIADITEQFNFNIPPDLDLGVPAPLPVSVPNLDNEPIVVLPDFDFDAFLETNLSPEIIFDIITTDKDPDLEPDLDPDKEFNIPFLGDIYQVLLNILNFLRNMINKFVVAFTEMLKSLFIPSSDFLSDFIAELDSVLKNKLGTNIYMPFINNLKELKGIPFPDLYIYGSKVVDASFLNSMADTSKLWQRWFYYFLIIFYNLNNVYKLIRNNDIIGRTVTGDFKG